MSTPTTTPQPTPSRRRPLFLTIGIAAALLIALGVFLVACTGGDDPDPKPTTPAPTETTPEPTPTEPTPEDPAKAARQEAIDAAQARYAEFIATSNEVNKAGGAGGYDALIMFLGTPELMQMYETVYAQWTEQGLRQTGDTKIAASKVTDLQGDPAARQTLIADLEVCLDNTGVEIVNPAGESVTLEDYPDRVLQRVQMQTQDDGRWTVVKDEPTEEC